MGRTLADIEDRYVFVPLTAGPAWTWRSFSLHTTSQQE